MKHTGLKYRRTNGSLEITAYCDSDYAQCRITRKSTTGVLIQLGNAVVHCTSSLQGSVALCSTEAEYISAAHAAKILSWIRQLILAWRIKVVTDLPKLCVDNKPYQAQPGHDTIAHDMTASSPLALKIDNKGAIDVAHATGPTKRTKHIDFKYHYIQQQVRRKELRLEQVATDEQRSDSLTKRLRRILFQRACNNMDC